MKLSPSSSSQTRLQAKAGLSIIIFSMNIIINIVIMNIIINNIVKISIITISIIIIVMPNISLVECHLKLFGHICAQLFTKEKVREGERGKEEECDCGSLAIHQIQHSSLVYGINSSYSRRVSMWQTCMKRPIRKCGKL